MSIHSSGGNRPGLGRVVALALVLCALAVPAQAAQVGASFIVKVDYQQFPPPKPEPPPGDEFCVIRNPPGAFGADVTVVCRTGAVVDISPGAGAKPWVPMHGGAYRFLPPVSWAGVMTGTETTQSGLGTVTTWRVVQLIDRQYVEMLLRW